MSIRVEERTRRCEPYHEALVVRDYLNVIPGRRGGSRRQSITNGLTFSFGQRFRRTRPNIRAARPTDTGKSSIGSAGYAALRISEQ